MAEQVLVRFSIEQPDCCEWLVLDHKGEPAAAVGRGTLGDLAPLCQKRQLILILPGEDVLMTRVKLPVRSAAGIAKALPYALEEQLAADVEDLHFARGPQDEEGRLPVAVIQQQCIEAYLDVLAQSGMQPYQAVPAPLLLPWEDNAWSLMLEGGQAMLRYGEYQGLELEADTLMPVLSQLLQEQADGTRPVIRVWRCGEPEAEPDGLRLTGSEYEDMPGLETALPLMASVFVKGETLGLLQGDYRQQDGALTSMRSWVPAAALLLIALVFQLGAMGYDYFSLQAEEQALQAEIETLFHETFPEVRRLVDARAQAAQQLAELRRRHGQGSDPFLSLLHKSGKALQQAKTLRLTGVSFKGGVLQLSLKGKDLSQFEGLKQQLEQDPAQRLEVKILSASTRQDGVDGRIQIQERAS